MRGHEKYEHLVYDGHRFAVLVMSRSYVPGLEFQHITAVVVGTTTVRDSLNTVPFKAHEAEHITLNTPIA